MTSYKGNLTPHFAQTASLLKNYPPFLPNADCLFFGSQKTNRRQLPRCGLWAFPPLFPACSRSWSTRPLLLQGEPREA